MSIDWITVAAQIANFLVLVWLLKRFLYRPILDGIEAREAEIKDQMQEAVQLQAQAQAVEQGYQDKLQDLSVAQSEMTETIRKAAEEQRDVLLAEARQRVEREHAVWKAQLDEEARKYTAKLHHAGAGALLGLLRKALSDLAGQTLEAQMSHHLVHKMKPMLPDLRRAAGQVSEAVVTSRDPLPNSAEEELSSGVQAVFPRISMRFVTDETQAPGLIIRIGGAQLEWTVASYIEGLSALIEEQLAAVGKPGGHSHGP